MAKNSVSDWDTTANNNTDVGGITLAENVMTAPLVNNAFREMMAQLKAGVNIRLSGTTDNALVRFDGTSGLIQGSAVSVTDTGIMSTNKYRATDTNGVTLASVAHGFQIGPDNASNLAFDDGEVQSRNNGAAADIAINRLGGAVNIGSSGAATNVLGSMSVAQTSAFTGESTFSGDMTVSAGVDILAGGKSVTVSTAEFYVNATTLFKVVGAPTVDISGVNVDISGSTLALEGSSLSLTSNTSPINLASHTKALSLETGTYSAGGGTDGTNIGASSYNVSKSVTTTATCANWRNPNGTVGSISINGTTTTYGTTSDERLKTDFEDFDAGEIIDQISMYKYAWKADGSIGYGPKAQELHGIFPVAVSEGSVGDQPGDETFEPWQYDAAKLVPLLIRETQSLRLRVAALEAASN